MSLKLKKSGRRNSSNFVDELIRPRHEVDKDDSVSLDSYELE